MSTYRERREARAERLRDWADSREAKSDAAYTKAKATADMIPFGQPMLTDHYSYRSDRNRRDRMHANWDRSFEHAAKAAEMRSKAANIEAAAAHAIYSDDPNAPERLAERIAGLEAERARWKAYNVSCRKGMRDLTLLDEHQAAGLVSIGKTCPYQIGKNGEAPGYVLSNLTGNIKRLRDRLARLTA